MRSLSNLTPELDNAVRAELRSGEEIRYAGMPAPKYTARKMWPIAAFGLLFGGFAAFWISAAAWGVWFGGGTGKPLNGPAPLVLFPLFGLPFLAIGLAMICSPWWVARSARRTACCVTSQRAMQVRLGRTIKTQSWGVDDLSEISKELYSDGLGTVLFAKSITYGNKGGARTTSEGFYGVPEPRACEEALLELKASFRSASDQQTEA